MAGPAFKDLDEELPRAMDTGDQVATIPGSPADAVLHMDEPPVGPQIHWTKERFAAYVQQGLNRDEVCALLGLSEAAYAIYETDSEVSTTLKRYRAEKIHREALLRFKLDQQQDKSLDLIVKMRDNPDVPWKDRAAAAQDLLDRGGYLRKQGAVAATAGAILMTDDQIKGAMVAAFQTLPPNGKEHDDG